MTERVAHVDWRGGLLDGVGNVHLDTSGLGPFPTSLAARAEGQRAATGPEELLASAHAACYAMQLAAILSEAGVPPTMLRVEVTITQGGPEVDFGLSESSLRVAADVDLPREELIAYASKAQERCPVSRALSVPITLTVDQQP